MDGNLLQTALGLISECLPERKNYSPRSLVIASSSRLTTTEPPIRTYICRFIFGDDSILFLFLSPPLILPKPCLPSFRVYTEAFRKIFFTKASIYCERSTYGINFHQQNFASLLVVAVWSHLIHSLDEFSHFFSLRKLSQLADRIDKWKAIFHNVI